jgi:hypothetical protein
MRVLQNGMVVILYNCDVKLFALEADILHVTRSGLSALLFVFPILSGA